MRSRPVWLFGAAAVAALSIWALTRPDDAPTAYSRTQRALLGAAGGAPDDGDPATRAPLPDERVVHVDVTTCRNRAARGATVVATVAGRAFGATADSAGRARLVLPKGVLATVRATIGRYTSEAVPLEDSDTEVTACPGAAVHGRLLDQDGEPVPGLTISLVDGAGEVIDQTESAEDGTYSVSDGMLVGAALVLPVDDGTRPLAGLSPAEDREVDLVVGRLREVVGWVVDMQGEPQPGVFMTMRAEKLGSSWTTVTGPGGEFRFAHAPATSVHVDADGGELGLASVRLAGSSAPRREVDLVLEPMGTITVYGPAEGGGVAVVRCFDQRFHGADNLYTDDLDETFSQTDGSGDADGIGEAAYDGDGGAPAPEIDAMFTAMAEGLRGFDRDNPEEGLTRMVRSMMSINGVTEMADFPQDDGSGVDVAVVAARQIMNESPYVIEMFAQVSQNLESGMDAQQAFEQATRSLDSPGSGEPVEMPADEAVAVEELPEVEVEPVGVDGSLTGDEGGVAVMGDEYVNAEIGAEYEPGPIEPPDPRAVAARGALGAILRVRASFSYQVSIEYPDGLARFCGTVSVDPGEDVVVRCADEVESGVIAGRVVDSAGQPVVGVMVSGGAEEATTGFDGRFRAQGYPGTSQTYLSVTDASGVMAEASRRGINVTAGEVTDVGDIVMRRPDELPIGSPDVPFGGIGGLVSLDEMGLHLDDLEPDSPLALAGADAGDTIVIVDGVPAAELSMDELLLRLRGDIGTHVLVRMRKSEGELYEVDLERALINVKPGKWDHGDPEVTEDW